MMSDYERSILLKKKKKKKNEETRRRYIMNGIFFSKKKLTAYASTCSYKGTNEATDVKERETYPFKRRDVIQNDESV